MIILAWYCMVISMLSFIGGARNYVKAKTREDIQVYRLVTLLMIPLVVFFWLFIGGVR